MAGVLFYTLNAFLISAQPHSKNKQFYVVFVW